MEEQFIKNTLKVGQIIKNYKELCGLLNQDVLNGKSKKIQLENFKRYFDYEKSGQKFIITDIYDEPLAKEDKRKRGNNSVYVKYIELILLQYLSRQNGFTQTLTKRNWWELLGMVNNKYLKAPKKDLKEADYTITNWEINHFYQRCNERLEKILFSALNSLKNRKLIIYELQTMIVDADEKIFLANDEDKKKILQEERYVLKEMGFEKFIQVICRFKQKEYYKKINERLNEFYNWKYYFKQVKLIYTPKDITEAISETKLLLQKEILNQKIIKVLNEDAVNKFELENKKWDKLCDNLILGETDEYDYSNNRYIRMPDTYLDAQTVLIDELINIGYKSKFTLEEIEKSEEFELNQFFDTF